MVFERKVLLGKWLAIAMLELKQVSYESGTLHNLCSYNLDPNSKDNSEYAVLCSLLQALTRGRGGGACVELL